VTAYNWKCKVIFRILCFCLFVLHISHTHTHMFVEIMWRWCRRVDSLNIFSYCTCVKWVRIGKEKVRIKTEIGQFFEAVEHYSLDSLFFSIKNTFHVLFKRRKKYRRWSLWELLVFSKHLKIPCFMEEKNERSKFSKAHSPTISDRRWFFFGKTYS
jgi:hypothetical protein